MRINVELTGGKLDGHGECEFKKSVPLRTYSRFYMCIVTINFKFKTNLNLIIDGPLTDARVRVRVAGAAQWLVPHGTRGSPFKLPPAAPWRAASNWTCQWAVNRPLAEAGSGPELPASRTAHWQRRGPCQ